MPSLTASFLTSMLAVAALAGQTAPDTSIQDTRLRLESERRELLAQLDDKDWMQDSGRATLARFAAEHGWTTCAANEALGQAKVSERPARLLAEAALAACQPWRKALELALERGAYPYIEAPDAPKRVSRDDMVETAHLAAQDAALARILLWRGVAPRPAIAARTDPYGRIETKPLPLPPRLAPPEPETPPAEAKQGENEIVVVARVAAGCRVRLADRTLTEKQLAAKAHEWAANGTALKVVRPRGADYRCMARIAWQLGKQGLRFFEFVEAADMR